MKLSVPHWAPSRVSDRLDAAIEATRAEAIESKNRIEDETLAVLHQTAGYVRGSASEVADALSVAAACITGAALLIGMYFAVKTVKELW